MREERKKERNWLLFIISTVTLLALCLAYILFYDYSKSNAIFALVISVLPNLVATLIIVVVVYLVLKRRGIDKEKEFKEDIIQGIYKEINQKLDGKNVRELAYFITQYNNKQIISYKEVNKIFDTAKKILSAKEIWTNGYSCINLIQDNRKEFVKSIINGANVKILITDKDSSAAKLMGERTVTKNLIKSDVERTIALINVIKDDLSHQSRVKGSIELKITTWIPSCSMFFYNPNNRNGEVKIVVYPPFHSTSKSSISVNFILRRSEDKDYFEYFKNQFSRLWDEDASTIEST